ncbi:organ-specific protein S2-like isoform X2 [Salvia hispanica]|uniref:organ-specific protein S2-like isoform X2 n=1 Tax=Salvia hispanica TaxID=49212 RepID=UPI002009D006|nr:organ-specific protein S2-like isoform X2 [Salvia hispanica]
MRYTIASFLLLSLIACSVNARKDGGEYWQGVVKDQKVEGNDCHTVGETSIFHVKPKYEESFANDFKRRVHTSTHVNHLGFVREFEPRPSATSYVGSKKEKSYGGDFKPRPNISAYTDDVGSKKEKSYGGHSEPPPNVSAYSDDVGSKKDKSYDGDFEPRPNVST